MAECQLKCSPAVQCKLYAQAKRIFEGESCALSYNEGDDWFNDENEEFVFDGSNRWFEDAHRAAVKEQYDMEFGYRRIKMVKRKNEEKRKKDKDKKR
jgi:hypothetical protein